VAQPPRASATSTAATAKGWFMSPPWGCERV
jgi:hypothetical protein